MIRIGVGTAWAAAWLATIALAFWGGHSSSKEVELVELEPGQPEEDWPPRMYMRIHADGTCVKGFFVEKVGFVADPPVLHHRKIDDSIDPKLVFDLQPEPRRQIFWQQYPRYPRHSVPHGERSNVPVRPPGFRGCWLWFGSGLVFRGYVDDQGRFLPRDGRLSWAHSLSGPRAIEPNQVTEILWP